MANKKPKGVRAKTRHKLKGKKLSVERLLQKFDIGAKVVITPNGRYHSGLPFRRFAGQIGEVVEKVGRAYKVYIKKMNKYIIVGNAHLKHLK